MKIVLLLSLLFILLLALVTSDQWPKFFSKPDLINPQDIKDNFDPNAHMAIFNNRPVPINLPTPSVLGQTTEVSPSPATQKRIEVDLSTQRLYAYEGNRLVYNFLISSGKWDRTPNGTFTIWTKIRSQKMSGGSKELGTYYYLPNVPYILFFYNQDVPKQVGYSLHGTYWHNNFGVPMSHGCINMKTEEVAQIYDWASIGTPVTIYGKYQIVLPSADLNSQSRRLSLSSRS